jgi:hypothetical protein
LAKYVNGKYLAFFLNAYFPLLLAGSWAEGEDELQDVR